MAIPMIKVFAIDPGVTTGWAEGRIDNGYMEVRCGQDLFGYLEFWDWLMVKQVDHLVCETFQFRKGKQHEGVNLYPCELIGIVNLFVEQAVLEDKNPPQLYWQSPATGKGFYTDEKLKEGNVYEIGKPHGRDATRHLLQWFTFGAGYQFNENGFGPWKEGK